MHQDYIQGYEETAMLQDEIIPNAQLAFEAAEEGFRQGKFSYLSVLDAQRSLFELKVQLLEAAAQARQALNDMNSITANYDLLNHDRKENK
jgi:cobalt-zinc-cadmium efflux system outer membrane protein